jgi:hypothetical protein
MEREAGARATRGGTEGKLKEERERRIALEFENDRRDVSRWKSCAGNFSNEREVELEVRELARVPRWKQIYPTVRHKPAEGFHSWMW